VTRRILFIVVVLASCRSRAVTTEGADASFADVTVAAAPSAPRAPKTTAQLADVVRAWNDATNAHDAQKLRSLYASEVELYGQTMSADKATTVKAAAFAKHDHDDVSELVLKGRRAVFRKVSKAKDGRVTDVSGYLEVDASMQIIAEGDTTTDANLGRAEEDRCCAALWKIAHAVPETKDFPGAGVTGQGRIWSIEFYRIGHVYAVDDAGEPSSAELAHAATLDVDLALGTVTYSGTNGVVAVQTDLAPMRGCERVTR
jgi:hypothetical protein